MTPEALKHVQLYGILEGYKTLKDKTLRIIFDTNEVKSKAVETLHQLLGGFCWMVLVNKAQDTIFLPEASPLVPEGKTASQRLRAVLYIEWEQGDKKINAEQHYQMRMNQVIDWVKIKLAR